MYKNALVFKILIFIFYGYKFHIDGSYFRRKLNSEQNKKTNAMSVDQKLREELSIGGSSNFGDFIGGCGEGGGFEKKVS